MKDNPFYEIYGLEAEQSPRMTPAQTQQLSRPREKWIKTMFGGVYNPDPKNYHDYRRIMKDPQVKLAKRLIHSYLLSKNYYITPASEEDKDKEIKEFVEICLKNMDIDMREVRKHLLSGMDYGYAVSEIVWKILADNRIGIAKLKGLQIETLENCFETDDLGEILNVIQTFLGQLDPVPIPAEKCLIYTFEGETGNPYGESIYRELNDPVFLKKKILLMLTIFLEKHGSPALAGKVGAEGDSKKFLEKLEDIREGRTSITHGADEEVYVIESQKDGEAFFKTYQMLEVLILRVFLIGSLILGQSEASGSYSQSQTHLDALKFFLDGIHADLAIIFQNLIKKLVDFNFTTDKYPQFHFEPFNELDLLGLLKELQPYAKNALLDGGNMEGLNQLIKRVLKEYGDIIVQELQDQNPQVTQEEKDTPIPTTTNQGITGQVKDVTGV
jgi:hypothetical protein